MAKKSSQKFIARNRAPRVQIEYDVEVYGAEKTLADCFKYRNKMEIDVDNFDSRMKALKPRAAFSVPNTLTGEGELKVDITFENLDDFSPAAVARKVAGLDKRLDARTQLANLVTYMDGKAGAEELISKALQDETLLQALASKAADASDEEASSEE